MSVIPFMCSKFHTVTVFFFPHSLLVLRPPSPIPRNYPWHSSLVINIRHVRLRTNLSYYDWRCLTTELSTAEVYPLFCKNIFCISFMNWQKTIGSPTSCPKEIFGKYLELIELFVTIQKVVLFWFGFCFFPHNPENL